MAKASTQSGQEVAAPETSAATAGNPFDGVTGSAELDTLMAAGFGDTGETAANREPADVADTVEATEKAQPPQPTEEQAKRTAQPDDLSSLIEEEAGTGGDDVKDDDGGMPDDSDADDDDTGNQAEMPKWVQKRLSKTAAQKRELREANVALAREKDELAEKVKALQANKLVLTPTNEDPLADITDGAALDLRLAQAKAVRDWVIANPDGGEIDMGNGKVLEISPAEAQRRKAAADDVLNFHAPRRAQWLSQNAQAVKEAKTHYPSIFNEGTRLNGLLENMVKLVPSLLSLPDHHLLIGDMLIGHQVRTGKLKAFKAQAEKQAEEANGKPSAKPRAPVRPSSPSTPEPAGKSGARAYQSLRKAAEAGNKEGIIAAMAALDD